MKIRNILFVLLFSIFLLNLASAAHYITGYVENASDGTSSDGYIITLWNPAVGVGDNRTDIIGITGGSATKNMYMIDCELLSAGCNIGDNMTVKVFDNGSNYVTHEGSTIVTGFGYELLDNITLYKNVGILTTSIIAPSNNSEYNISDVFYINITLNCLGESGASCGIPSSYLEYNDTRINVTENANPFFISKIFRNITNLADTYIDQNLPDNNYGSSPILYTGVKVLETRTWLKFNINSLPVWAIINIAKLGLYKYSDGDLNKIYSIYNHSNNTWEEGSLTWNSKPTGSMETSFVNITTGGSSWVIWNVTNSTKNNLYTNSNLSFEVKQNESLAADEFYFYSKESVNENKPYLEVEFNTPNPINYSSIIYSGQSIQFYWLINASQRGYYRISSFANSTINSSEINSNEIYLTIGDLVSPSISLNYPTNEDYTSSFQDYFNFTATDNYLSTCELWGNWTGTWHKNYTWINPVSGVQNYTLVNISDGYYNWTVWCNDTSGNSAFPTSNRTFTKDTIYPEVNITSPANGSSFTATLTFNYTIIDANLDTCVYNILENSTWEYTSNQTISCGNGSTTVSLFIGTYDVYLWVKDEAGNRNQSKITVSSISNPTGGGGGTTNEIETIVEVPSNQTFCGDGICQTKGNDLGVFEDYFSCPQDCAGFNIDSAVTYCFDGKEETVCIWSSMSYQYWGLFLGGIGLLIIFFSTIEDKKTKKQIPLYKYYSLKFKEKGKI